jgi:hypothetical protein
MTDKLFKKEDFFEFMYRLINLRYKKEFGGIDVFNKEFIPSVYIYKGQTTNLKNLQFNLEPCTSIVELGVFAKIDELCKKYNVRCTTSNGSFNFSMTMEPKIYEM